MSIAVLHGGGGGNATTDEMFAAMRKYWTEDEIVEIVGVRPANL